MNSSRELKTSNEKKITASSVSSRKKTDISMRRQQLVQSKNEKLDKGKVSSL